MCLHRGETVSALTGRRWFRGGWCALNDSIYSWCETSDCRVSRSSPQTPFPLGGSSELWPLGSLWVLVCVAVWMHGRSMNTCLVLTLQPTSSQLAAGSSINNDKPSSYCIITTLCGLPAVYVEAQPLEAPSQGPTLCFSGLDGPSGFKYRHIETMLYLNYRWWCKG